jgi:hypothetical protein
MRNGTTGHITAIATNPQRKGEDLIVTITTAAGHELRRGRTLEDRRAGIVTTASTNLAANPARRCVGDTHIETSSIDDPAGSGRYPPTIPTTDLSTMAR